MCLNGTHPYVPLAKPEPIRIVHAKLASGSVVGQCYESTVLERCVPNDLSKCWIFEETVMLYNARCFTLLDTSQTLPLASLIASVPA